ncbi:MAG: AAA family ATPase [Lachnospiraceae bacterium]|nr:AAA family ATPase [Lachnospiraceae bacterium]
MKMPLAIGIDNYKELIDKKYYYVDKTLLIKNLLDNQGKVNLITRPRRFGKTLALSMIKTYFEQEFNPDGSEINNQHYFEGKHIFTAGEYYRNEFCQYPVISLSLKSARQPDFEMAYASLIDEISKEFGRHSYILQKEVLPSADRVKFTKIWERRADGIDYAKSLEFLSHCLEMYHHKKVIILIDEYDVPLESSYFRGFYGQMIDFIRSLFESALKTNDSLEFSVITGCLRISKESIFTGLNNLEIFSVLNQNYAEYFGFVQAEVEQLLQFYQILEKKEEVRHWYDGYLFGNIEVYNPWSVLNYVKEAVTNTISFPKPYWSNTSSNSIVRELIDRADPAAKQEIELLIEDNAIEKPVHEDITYEDIHKSQDNLWNFLFFTGYLKMTSKRFDGDMIYLTLKIPNAEIKYIYRNTILNWFNETLKTRNLSSLYHAVTTMDTDTFSRKVTEELGETISFFDFAENYYHGFLAGLLKGCPGYIVKSNRESGNGRPDLIMKTPSVQGCAIIMEYKIAKRFEQMAAGCADALQQIKEQDYAKELRLEGYRNIISYGVCFYRKECLVKVKKL